MTADSQHERPPLRLFANGRVSAADAHRAAVDRHLHVLRDGHQDASIGTFARRPLVERHRQRGKPWRRPKRRPSRLFVCAGQAIFAALANVRAIRMHGVHLKVKMRTRCPTRRTRMSERLTLPHPFTAANVGAERVPIEMQVHRGRPVSVVDDDVVGEIDTRRALASGVAAHLHVRHDAFASRAHAEARAVGEVPRVLAAADVIGVGRVVAVLGELHRQAGCPRKPVRSCTRTGGPESNDGAGKGGGSGTPHPTKVG